MKYNTNRNLAQAIEQKIDPEEFVVSVGSSGATEEVLYVSKAGSNGDGQTWETAKTTLAAAITAASTTKKTTILIGEGTWDVATTNYLIVNKPIHLIGAGKHNTLLKNTSGTSFLHSVLAFTDAVYIENIGFPAVSNRAGAIYIGSAGAGSTIENCYMDLTGKSGSCYAITINGGSNCIIKDCEIRGTVTQTTGISIQNASNTIVENVLIRDCSEGVKTSSANNDYEEYINVRMSDCAYGFQLVDGDNRLIKDCTLIDCTLGINNYAVCNEGTFININFAGCTNNIAEAATDSKWINIHATNECGFIEPADLAGDAVTSGTDQYGTNTSLLAASAFVKKVVGFGIENPTAEMTSIRFSTDSGTTHFYETVLDLAAATMVKLDMPEKIVGNLAISCSISAKGGNRSCLVFLHLITL